MASASADSFPCFVASAPGKLILCGEHAVVHGSHALASVLDRRTYAEFSPLPGRLSLEISGPGVEGRFSWPITEIQTFHGKNKSNQETDEIAAFRLSLFPGLSELPVSVQVFLLFFFNALENPIGLRCKIASELPIGAGLGSSASFCAALASGFSALNAGRFDEIPEEAKAWINHWAFLGEKIIHGNPSGVDNTCVVHGGLLLFRRGFPHDFLRMPPLSVLVTDTHQEKSTAKLVAGVGRLKEKMPTVVNPIIEAIDSLVMRVASLLQAPTALLDFELSEIFLVNQHLLNALGVGHPVIDQVVQNSSKLGLASKLTGAGGGGCAITLVSQAATRPQIAELVRLNGQHGFHSFETTIGDGGVKCSINKMEDLIRQYSPSPTVEDFPPFRFPFPVLRAGLFMAASMIIMGKWGK